MKMTLKNVALGLALCGLASCANEAPWGKGNGTGEGSLRLNLTASSEVSSAVPKLRAVSTEIVTPPVEDFQIRLTKTDGSYTQEWSSITEFLKETEFSVGTYEIEAFYGDANAQGSIKEEQVGYEYAYYYGKTSDIIVLEGQTTDVQLHAELANAIIAIEYTDAFKNYFTNWRTILQTDGNSPVDLGGAEGMTYVIPGEVNITISADQQNGKIIKLSPGKFAAEAQHMYKMRYNIYNGEIDGVDKLVIEFDDSLVEEPIIVDLSDELQNATAPIVTPTGFENGQSFANLSGTPFDGEIKFNVVAHGSIAAANLTIESDTYKPDFLQSGVIDLCTASDDQVSKMEAAGIKAIGFFKKTGEMAQLDLTDLCKSLPEGNHKFIFQVVDKFQQTNEPVDVTIASIPIDVSVEPISAPFGEGYADIRISYNGPDPTTPSSNPFSFQAAGDGAYVPCEVISIRKEDATRSFESHDYIYRISIPTAQRDEIPLRIFFNGNEKENEMTNLRTDIAYQYSKYEMEYDPMATVLRMRTTFGDATKNKRFIHKLRVFVDDVEIPENSIKRNETSGVISISGFNPSVSYSVKTTLQSKNIPSEFGSETQLTTEQALQIPNGDFSESHTTIDKEINAGGQYKYGATTMQNKSKVLVNEPVGWASINELTCYSGSNPFNTWFAVPSTIQNGNEVVIRSVAYDHNGKLPDLDNHGLSVRAKYSRNKPSSWSNYAAGELFLGSYSYNGSETRNDEISFIGRPVSISFDYLYSPVNNEVGDVEIELIDSNGKTIAHEIKSIGVSATNPSSKDTFTVTLPDYGFGVKVAKMKLKFRSSTAPVPAAPVPDDIQDVTNTTGLSGQTISDNKYKSLCTGSQLTISNVRLNY